MTRTRILSLAGAATAGLLLTACGGLSDDDRERASDAALAAVGDGRVTEVEEADSEETAAYNVEVSLDGESIDVELDDDFEVLNQEDIDREKAAGGGVAAPASPSESASASPTDAASPSSSPQVDDDTPLQGEVKQRAEQAALDEVGGGRVTESTYADPGEDHVYEVEVERGNGDDDDVTVELAEDYSVVRVDR